MNGVQAVQTSHATAKRIAVNRASALANRQLQIDVATLIQWVNARQENRPALAAFYQARFRPEFKPAFEAWVATKPFTNKAAPPTPFAMRQYRLKAILPHRERRRRRRLVRERLRCQPGVERGLDSGGRGLGRTRRVRAGSLGGR